MNTETGETVEGKPQLQDGDKPPLRIAGICGSLQPNGTTSLVQRVERTRTRPTWLIQ